MENTVTISLDTYNEMHRKALVYDQRKRELELDLMEGSYVCNSERALFELPSKETTSRKALEVIKEKLEKELAESGVE